MAYSAHDPYGTHSTDADHYADAFLAALDVAPTDRIGPPRARRIGRWIAWGALLTSIAGAGAIHYDDPSRWPRWWSEATAVVAPLLERSAPAVPRPLSASATDTALPSPENRSAEAAGAFVAADAMAAARDVSAAVETVIAAPPPVAAVEPEQVGAEPDTAAAARKTPPADPNRARAAKAGLNPDISRALLARLSDADYRNAGVAIQKALAETPDDNVLYWPLKTKPGVAQFQVHFVPSANDGCRRYVVTIAKDGWATTALPMDKCGVKQAAAKSG